MNTVTVTYTIKYELSTHPNYVWTKDDICFNIKTGRKIRQVYNKGSIGYNICGKFKSIKSLRPLLRKPKNINCPF
jgi:hypothetical protein